MKYIYFSKVKMWKVFDQYLVLSDAETDEMVSTN